MERGGESVRERGSGRKKKVSEPEAKAPAPAAIPPPPEKPRLAVVSVKTPASSLAVELERLQAEWPRLVAEIGAEHSWLRTDLLDSWPVEISDTTCRLGFDPEFAGEIDEVQKRGYSILHDAVVAHTGRKLNIECCLAKEPVRWSHHLKHPQKEGEVPSGNLRAWEAHPAIRQILEVFHGDVRDVQR